MTAEDLVRELVGECSPSEHLRLLAWANAPRVDEITQNELRNLGGSGFGPELDQEPILTHAVAAGIL